MIKLFWATLSFLSRLPVPERWSQGLDIDRYVRGIVTFPVVGALLGLLSGLVFLAVQAWCGIPLAALFAVLALALLTGGFHLDGLADTCDGVFSARRRERMLEIMRDSRLGTHGGLALILSCWRRCWWSASWRCAARRCWRRWRRPARQGGGPACC